MNTDWHGSSSPKGRYTLLLVSAANVIFTLPLLYGALYVIGHPHGDPDWTENTKYFAPLLAVLIFVYYLSILGMWFAKKNASVVLLVLTAAIASPIVLDNLMFVLTRWPFGGGFGAISLSVWTAFGIVLLELLWVLMNCYYFLARVKI